MTRRFFIRLLALLSLLSAACLPARADTPVTLWKYWRGNVNFTGTEATLRVRDNRYPCSLVSSSTGVSATLSGIPSGATIKSAQLYWAGSGNAANADYSVSFDGVGVSAGRKYTSNTIGNGYNYFSGAADVTTQVAKKGNGTYTFSGLTVSTGSPWCSVQGVVGGFALVVVYSHPNEPFRLLNLYEGFQGFRYNGLTINLGDFNIPNPLPDNVTGRVGHITWEGDSTLSQGGEDLLFNGYALTDRMNPSGNQFNSASNVNGDTTSYGIDFDVYTLKPPVIQPGQNKATTTYQTGQDLVLLGAEIVAMPYVASADLALSMTLGGTLQVGTSASYALTVSNIGTDADTGPVTIADTLPAGMKLVSTGGTGWSCTNAAGTGNTTVVTCTQNTALAAGSKLPTLTISVAPTAVTSYTNSATVSGTTSDSNAANNTATNTTTAAAPAGSNAGTGTIPGTNANAAVFTREVCTPGQRIVATNEVAANTCRAFAGPVIAGDTTTKIYITTVKSSSDSQMAIAAASTDVTVAVAMKASCLPNSGVKITYAGTTFDCGAAAKSVNLTIKANQATVDGVAAFSYPDVGQVTLSAGYSPIVASTTFISKPTGLRVRDVVRSDGYVDANTGSDGLPQKADLAFARAGQAFTLRIGALMADGTSYAPSFGKEATALKNVLDDNLINSSGLKLDRFVAGLAPLRPLAGADGQTMEGTVKDAFVNDGVFSVSSTVAGALETTVRYYEAGYLAVSPYLNNYLGTGPIGAPPDDTQPKDDGSATNTASTTRIVAGTRVVGRFYPDHFVTNVDEAFACQAPMNCPAPGGYDADKKTWPVSGAVYSSQPFRFTVTAYAMDRDGAPATLSLFKDLAAGSTSAYRTALKYQTVPVPNGGGAQALVAAPAPVPTPQADTDSTGVVGYGVIKLPAVYSLGPPVTTSWTAPTLAYIRASMTEVVPQTVNTTPPPTTIGSIAPDSAPAGTQYEDGVMVVNGRLQVQNVLGAELVRVPVPVTAQYWSGSAWMPNIGDNSGQVDATITLKTCSKALAVSTAGACKPNVVNVPGGTAAVALTTGKGTLTLAGPGRSNPGSADFTVGNGTPVWLPSTLGRITFGQFRSPVIYLREVY